jgi:serine phosphatase RsbU (regulator of sigma subunit)
MASGRARTFFDQYTADLTSADVRRLFTRDTAEAYRYFTRNIDEKALAALPWHRRAAMRGRLVFSGFTMRLSPARRALYGAGLASTLIGLILLFRGLGTTPVLLFPFTIRLPLPQWESGAMWLLIGFIAVNLLVLMEVADRLTLKSDLEIARDIQLAMLPGGEHTAGDAVAFGLTRPANTVGGDFYDIIPLADGRLALALGDVAGKGSPAALLMALLLAMLRTLVDEGLDAARLVERLNVQVGRHSPPSRFITLFYAIYDPMDGRLQFVNAGHLPPLLRRRDGRLERIGSGGGGLALGMFETATYETARVIVEPGDTLVLFSDGITEAEDARGRAFDDAGLAEVVQAHAAEDPAQIARGILRRVEAYVGDVRLADDLTALVLKRGAAEGNRVG